MPKSNLKFADPKLFEAIDFLKSLHERQSLEELAKQLDPPVEKSTIGRWIRYRPPGGRRERPRIESHIKAAAEFYKRLERNPAEKIKVTFAVIPRATEMAPVLLLPFYADWQSELNVEVTIDPKSSIEDALTALQNHDVHATIAPRHARPESYPGLQRVVEIASITVAGLFPFEFEGEEHFAGKLYQMLKDGLKCGVLRNANYDISLKAFMENYEKENPYPPSHIRVSDHDEACKLLKDREIHAILGHPIFISNCVQCLAGFTPQLHHVKSFKPIKMDALVNVDPLNDRVLVKVLGLLNKAIDAIRKAKIDPTGDRELIRNLNDALGLKPQKPKKKQSKEDGGDIQSAEHVIKNYTYEMTEFNIQFLLDFLEEKCGTNQER